MPDLDTILQDFASFIEEELPPPDVGTVLSAAAMPPAMPRRWLRPVLVAAASAMLVLVVVGLPFLFLSGDESIVDEPSTTTVASTTLPPTTVPSTTVASTTVAPTTTPPTKVQPTPAAPAEVVPFPPSEVAVLEVPLSEAIPGFTDTIVMLTTTKPVDGDPTESFNLLWWRSSEPMTELVSSLDRTEGPPVGLDASGDWVAQVLDSGDLTVHRTPGGAGESVQSAVVASHVDSAPWLTRWHDTEPGQLAWLECSESPSKSATLLALDVSDSAAEPTTIRSFEQGCLVDIFQRGSGEVALLRWGSEGALMMVHDGNTTDEVFIDANGTEVPIEPDSPRLAEGPDGPHRNALRMFAEGLAADGYMVGLWSPDDAHFAVNSWDDRGLHVADTATGAVVAEIMGSDSYVRVNTMAWSGDGRFLLYALWNDAAKSSTLGFYDIATNTTTEIPLTEYVEDIRVR